jgi:large subunit ribosomal protein L25
MAEQLTVQVRENLGKRHNRRLRKAGSVPAVLYGHGQKNVCLVVPADQLGALVHRGNRLVTLTGAVHESAFIREVQWDTFATQVLHVDFTRVSAHEKVELALSVELRGEAPGIKDGGVVEQLIHEVSIECPASAVPEKLEVNVNNLNLEESITIADLMLPEGARVLADPDGMVVHCIMPAEIPEEEVAEAVAGEPEVIGADKEAEETKGD